MSSKGFADYVEMRGVMRLFNDDRELIRLPECAGSPCPGTLLWVDGEMVCSNCD